MFTNCFEDKILVVLESMFITCLTIILNPYNNIIADFICEATQIPFDFALNVTSAGFGYNIIILLLVAEIILAVLFVEKLIPMLIHKLIWNCWFKGDDMLWERNKFIILA